MSTLIVNDVLELMDWGEVRIFLNEKTYLFDNYNIPDEVLYATIGGIDNPAYEEKGLPLCFNLMEEDFEDIEGFEAEYKDYIEC